MAEEIVTDIQVSEAESPAATAASQGDTYSANPNQITYDQSHTTDHLVDVVAVFFAAREPQMTTERKSETYTIQNRGTVADVLAKYQQEGRSNFSTIPDHQNPLTKGQAVTVSWDETVQEKDEKGALRFNYTRLEKGELGCETWLVARVNGDAGTLKVAIHEDKGTEEPVLEHPVTFLEGDTVKTVAEFTLNGAIYYPLKIKIRPQDDEQFRETGEKINARADKTVLLFLTAEVSGTSDEIRFPGNNPEFYTAVSGRFKAKYCECCLYKIENNLLQGPGVVHSKPGSKVTSSGALDADVLAVVLHRTAGSSTAGAIGHSKGTHFYVDGSRGVDGEIFQAVSLDKRSSHIRDVDTRIARTEVLNRNSVGIEVVGLAFYYNKAGEFINATTGTVADPASYTLTAGYPDSAGVTYYWQTLTDKQVKAVTCIVKQLLKKYDLKKEDILLHEAIQMKTAGEGAGVWDAIKDNF